MESSWTLSWRSNWIISMFFKNMLSKQILPIKCFRTTTALIFPIHVKHNILTCLWYVSSYGPKSSQARKTLLDTSRICMAWVNCEFFHELSNYFFLRIPYCIQGINILCFLFWTINALSWNETLGGKALRNFCGTVNNSGNILRVI